MQDSMVRSHLETKQTKAKQRKKTNNKQTGSPMKISVSHWVTSLAAELRLLEVLPGVAADAPVHTSSPFTQSWPGSSVSPCALCTEEPDREEHGVLETLSGEWRQTRFWLYPASSQTTAQLLDTNCPENQPALGRRCCGPRIWCRPTKTSGLADLLVSLGTTSTQVWRGHSTDTQVSHCKPAGKTSLRRHYSQSFVPLREISQEGYLGVKLNYAEVRVNSLLF